MKSLVELCEEYSKLGHTVSAGYRNGKISSLFISCRGDMTGIRADVSVSVSAGDILVTYNSSIIDELDEKGMVALQATLSFIRGVGAAVKAAMQEEWKVELEEYGG